MMKRKLKIAAAISLLMLIAGVCLLFFTADHSPGKAVQAEEGRLLLLLCTIDKEHRIQPLNEPRVNIREETEGFWIYFQSQERAFVYLLLFGPAGSCQVLFPSSLEEFTRDYQFTDYFIPDKGDWNPLLTTPGTYELYFLASVTPLREFNGLITAYYSEPGLQVPELRHKFLAELRKFSREELWEDNLEQRPEHIAGVVRGTIKEKIILEARPRIIRDLYVRRYQLVYGGSDAE